MAHAHDGATTSGKVKDRAGPNRGGVLVHDLCLTDEKGDIKRKCKF